jgi:Pyruvate/2-oxoacid:ferredoxin oxidoreductase gamma subunit
LKEGGTLLINSDRSGKELTKELGISNVHCYTVDATKISLDVFGSGKAFNTAMLGALLKAVPVVSTESLTNAMKERFSAELIDKNLQVFEKGMTEVKVD